MAGSIALTGFVNGKNPRVKLYATPAAVPLTDEQIDELWAECMDRYPSALTIINLARAIERAHGIGDKS